jgi:tetratricopeptide (TPR) repeat protein
MGDDTLVITEAGFLREFLNQHTKRPEQPFCFILGAGVSRSSGIPTGGEMAMVWLRELHEAANFKGQSLEEWATPERIGIDDFRMDELARFYPQLYQRKYRYNARAGIAFLEDRMAGKEPSYGYSVLAYLLAETQHRVVVTTNFDNLVADALSIHSKKVPLRIDDDALVKYAAADRHPLLAKVHGGLGFSPKSAPDDISTLSPGWCATLEKILARYTPIVIGYEGNDGSLMGCLKKLPADIPDRLLWCVYDPDATADDCLKRVSPEVREYVESRHGLFVPIGGFDELMAILHWRLHELALIPDLHAQLKERALLRETNYKNQQEKLSKAVAAYVIREMRTGTSSTSDTADTEPVQQLTEKDEPPLIRYAKISINEHVWLKTLKESPSIANLVRYAQFLEQERLDYDNAELYYERALAADPREISVLVPYADFLNRKRNDSEKAEKYFKLALEIDPDNHPALTSYAHLLHMAGRDLDKAEELYKRAIKAEPRDAYVLELYAEFLRDIRKDYEKAEQLQTHARYIRTMVR